MHRDFFMRKYTFSGNFTSLLISASEITARFKDILEVGTVRDEAGMKICCLCVVRPLPGAPPFFSRRLAKCISPRGNNLQGGISFPKM